MGGGGGGGGGGFNPIKAIGEGVSNIGRNPTGAIAGYLGGTAIGGPVGSVVGTAVGANNLFKPPAQPTAPGVDPGLSAVQQQQQQQAQQFRANLPQNENTAYSDLAQASGANTNQAVRQAGSSNSARGLLYGGVNQGQQQGIRANNQVNLAKGKSDINNQYETEANKMDAAAVGTGVAIQQTQQSVQDQIYKQALLNMNNQNNAFGSLLGAGGAGLGLALA